MEPLVTPCSRVSVQFRPSSSGTSTPVPQTPGILAAGVTGLLVHHLGLQRSRRLRVAGVDAPQFTQDQGPVYGRMNDQEILSNLRDRHGWTSQDQGAGGNCLFLSMALQVDAEDVRLAPTRSPLWEETLGGDLAERWQGLRIQERALLLRRMAILDEAEFIEVLSRATVGATVGALEDDVEWRLAELFTDMAEEFVSSNKTELAAGIPGWDQQGIYARVRQVVAEYSLEQKCDFVLKHAAEYLQTTGREGNWAGSSEMAALSSVLQRPVLAYGNNNVSQDGVRIRHYEDGSREVLPYFEARCFEKARGEPIRVFQTHGGGHYQMLA